jgi:hypothetical protein
LGGQLGTERTGRLLDGIEAQNTQPMRNALMVLAAAGSSDDYDRRFAVGMTNSTLTWPEFTGPDAKTCRVGED